MPMDAGMMATGGMPQGGMPQGQPPQGQSPQTQIAPGQAQTADPQVILKALQAVIQQAVDKNGYVDMNKLVTLWPQIAQQMGINVPFQTVMQLIQQNPSLIENLIVQMGLAGIISNGRMISGEQLMGMGSGATGMGGR